MCNCGKRRTAYSQSSQSSQPLNANTRMSIPSQTNSFVTFQYVGKTALTVIGNITGTQYRFNQPGSQVNINSRDMPAMSTIPVLKRV